MAGKRMLEGTEYWINADGAMVDARTIKEIDRLRDEVVGDVIAQGRELSRNIRAVKTAVYEMVDAFLALSAEQYSVKQGGAKGNVSLLSFDGALKVTVAIADVLTFDERLQTAKTLIDECLLRWSDGASHNLAVVVREAFRVDKKQHVDVKRILELRRYEINDEQWKEAMKAIGDSITVQSTRRYVRMYDRQPDGQWKQIPLDWATI